MNIEIFYKTPKDLEKAVGYISPKTGEVFEFKKTDKRVIVYLLDRLNFFVEKLGLESYESQSTIATALGLHYKHVANCLRQLIDEGVLVAEKKKPDKGRERWFYRAVNTDVVLWVGTKDCPILLDNDGNPVNNANKVATEEVVAERRQEDSEGDEELPPWAR